MSKTYVVVGHSRDLMVFDKEKLYEIGGVRRDDIKKWAPEHKGPVERSHRDGSGGLVVDEHEDDDENEAYEHRVQARSDGVATQRRADRPLFDDRHGRGELTGAEEDHGVAGLLVREVTRDRRRRAGRDPALDDGGLLHDPVEHQSEILADVGTRVGGEGAAAGTSRISSNEIIGSAVALLLKKFSRSIDAGLPSNPWPI